MGILSEPIQFSEKVWLKHDRLFGGIHVCYPGSDGVLGHFMFLRVDSTGVYYDRDTPVGKISDQSFRDYIEKISCTDRARTATKPRDDNNTALFENVCQSYQETKSIKKTAKDLGVSEERTRKILITKGMYTCMQYENIKKLLDEGKNIDEISEQLKMMPKQVRAYLPYNNNEEHKDN